MATFDARFCDKINKSKAQEFRRSFSSTILKGNQMAYLEIRK